MQKLPYFDERIEKIRTRKEEFLSLATSHETPFYVFDPEEARRNVRRFREAFAAQDLPLEIYFAVKSNPYAGFLRLLVESGIHLDVSSTKELILAREAGCKKLVYTGPGKTEEALREALSEHDIIIHLDSFVELERLRLLLPPGKTVRCGVRVQSTAQSDWSKFGILLNELRKFFDTAAGVSGIRLCAIHFHRTYNFAPSRYVTALREIAKYLRENFSKEELSRITHLDIGGGFPSPSFEATYPWNKNYRALFDHSKELKKILADEYSPRFIVPDVTPIEKFASAIAKTVRKEILPLMPDIQIAAEPGAWLSHSVLHMMLRVVDKKPGRALILDGGVNMIGYEKYQYFFYVPTFNLSRFSTTREEPYCLYGSLCTPNDIWGYYLHGDGVEIGDVIIVPYQGDYTYTYAMPNFIQSVPPVVHLHERARAC